MSFHVQNNKYLVLFIALVSALIFIPFLGACPLFDWDEINFAECAREMIITKDYSNVQLYYRAFWEKPPFFIWMQALSMHFFGVNEFAARFPNAICGIVTLNVLFWFGKKFHSQKFALIWCLTYAAALLPHFYFKSGIIDPWFNLFILLSIFNLIQVFKDLGAKASILKALLAGCFLGLAVLTKGPAALIIVALTIICYLIYTKSLSSAFNYKLLLFVLVTIFVASSWFIVEILKGNKKVVYEFIDYQIRLFQTGDAGHDGPFYYHLIVLLLGCFPFSIFFIHSLFMKEESNSFQNLTKKIMLCLFWAVMLIFSIVKTKIIHYSSICYFPITFFASNAFLNQNKSNQLKPVLSLVFWMISIFLSLAFTFVCFIDIFKNNLITKGLIKDQDAILNLQANGHWVGYEFIVGIIYLIAGIFIFRYFRLKKSRLLYIGLLCYLIFNIMAIGIIVPRIGLYSQEACVDFYKSKANENCYIETFGFKSYAHLFYGNRLPFHFENQDQKNYVEKQLNSMESEGRSRIRSFPTAYTMWLEHGEVDRDTYIVIKTSKESLFSKSPVLKKLYDKNGFSFYYRKAKPTVN